MGFESGKGGSGLGRNGYRREVRRWDDWQSDRVNNGNLMSEQDRSGNSVPEKGTQSSGNGMGGPFERKYVSGNSPSPSGSGSPQDGGLIEVEKRLAGLQQDFKQALEKVGEKENEKFDLIFAILVELQSRQAELERSVRELSERYGGSVGSQLSAGGGTAPASMSQSSPQFGGGASAGNQNYGSMNGQMAGQMNNQQSMQQFQGVMQTGGSQVMFTAVPQVIVMSPSGAGMQYAMPQLMSPSGGMESMQMQYMGQTPGGDLAVFVGSSGTPTGDADQEQHMQITDVEALAQQQQQQQLFVAEDCNHQLQAQGQPHQLDGVSQGQVAAQNLQQAS